MSKYFMLECYGSESEERAGVNHVMGVDDVDWLSGHPIREEFDNPIRVELDADDGVMMSMFDSEVLLMSDALIGALRDAGVDNIDCYPAILTNPHTGIVFENYKVVNVIGVVAASDPSGSVYRTHGSYLTDVDFDSLRIDESKASGLLMFRLAECITGLVVHERVRRCVERAGVVDLDWVPPEEWVG